MKLKNGWKRGVAIPIRTRKILHALCNGACEARIRGCLWFASELHHLLSRARGGENSITNLLSICSSCHHSITTHKPGTELYRFSNQDSTDERKNKEELVFRFRNL